MAHTLKQDLWPDHAVQGSHGSELSKDLVVKDSDIVIKKGLNAEVDSYSAFFDNGGFSMTEMDKKLKALDVGTVYCVGLAWDYCVSFTAIDATKLGYECYVIEDATKAISPEGFESAKTKMLENNVKIIKSSDVSLKN